MKNTNLSSAADADRRRLEDVLVGMKRVAIAVSGGVDSMTLAATAGRLAARGGTIRATMMHAVSPAVPPAATRRVRDRAAREGWRLEVLDAGEFADPAYLGNPVDRCFYCKTNLYGRIAAHLAATGAATGKDATILSGTNLDDLGDYRPGLTAARNANVRHPFVEAGIDKAQVRAIARTLGLDDVAELPAAPCLSSRVETGIPIRAADLALVDAVEEAVRRRLAPATVRCRIRADGVVVELDAGALARLDAGARRDLATDLATATAALAERAGRAGPIRLAPYRRGSAFLNAARAGSDAGGGNAGGRDAGGRDAGAG